MGVTVRTDDIDQAIIEGLSAGRPLAVICREQGVGLSTVYDWRAEDEDLAGRIARAREVGFDAIAERVRATARGKGDEDGDSTGDVQRDKLIIETDLKLLAKWDPKRYGDRVQHTGEGGGPIQAAVSVKFVGDE